VEKILKIDGMQCEHCKASVEKALNAVDGVNAKADLISKTATVTLSADVADQTLKNAVTDSGFEVVSIEKGIRL
jgi:copper chaperone CopZ